MLALRLQRIGRRNEAHFKIVVIEKTKGPKSQKYVDIVGSYNPKLGRVIIDEEKAKKWLSNGVQPSVTVYNMLVDKGIIEGKKKNALPKKTPIVKEAEEQAEENKETTLSEQKEQKGEEEAKEGTTAEEKTEDTSEENSSEESSAEETEGETKE